MTAFIQTTPSNTSSCLCPASQQGRAFGCPSVLALNSCGDRSLSIFPGPRPIIALRDAISGILNFNNLFITLDRPYDADLVKSYQRIWEIELLEDDWNEDGAKAFSPQIIQRVRDIVSTLAKQPFIFPTARESIQMEYEKSNGDYLEFELFESGQLKKFYYGSDGKMLTEYITDNEMREAVDDFYTE